MCGIIGYTGPLTASRFFFNGLAQLEYRGYDSAGIAYFGSGSKIHVIKTVGKVAQFGELCKGIRKNLTAELATPDGRPMVELRLKNVDCDLGGASHYDRSIRNHRKLS